MMAATWDRRKGPGRRRSDRALNAYRPAAVRGLLHDLGHQVATLSCLVEAVRGEDGLPEDARRRMDILALELSHLLDMIAAEPSGTPPAAETGTVELRSLGRQVAQLAEIRHCSSVTLLPGSDVIIEADFNVMRRVLTNVVENAARAAGAGGRVEISIRNADGAVIDITDDGPGFGQGAHGTASLGLSVVTSLLDSCGGSLEVRSPQAGGTLVSIRLPAAGGGRSNGKGGRHYKPGSQ